MAPRNPELEALATAEQKARFKVDPWFEVVETWIGKRTSVAEILEQALSFEPKVWSRSAEMRISNKPITGGSGGVYEAVGAP